MARISIGMLAWNEAGRIERTIRSLFQQSLLRGEATGRESLDSVELVVVCNGCTDDTADVAREVLRAQVQNVPRPPVHWRVEEVDLPDKVNAWNEFIHRLSDRRSDYLLLLDADVELPQPTALTSLVAALQQDAHVLIAAGTPVKRAALQPWRSIRERISLAFSGISRRACMTYVCGMLYASRASFLRSLRLPLGMLGEDSFLMVMAITNLGTSEGEFDRVVHPADAVVVYDPYLRPATLVRQHKRRVIARHIDQLLLEHLQEHREEAGVSELLRRRHENDPSWLIRLVRRRVAAAGRWVLPRHVLTLRFHEIRALGAAGWSRLPLAIAELPLKVAVYLAANRALRRDEIGGAWRDVRGGQGGRGKPRLAPSATDSPAQVTHAG